MPYAVCPAVPGREDLERYREEGYLAYEGLLSEDEVRAALEALSRLGAQLHRKAREGSPEVRVRQDSRPDYTDMGTFIMLDGTPFFVQFQAGEDPLALPYEKAELRIRKMMNFKEIDPVMGALARHPVMLSVVRSILGPEPIIFQDTAFCKPPHLGVEKPWHQDDAYFSFAPVEAVMGVWIALDPAKAENGCMHVIPGGHRKGALKHFHGRDCEIVPDRLDLSSAVPVELAPGGVLFFSGLLPHETPPNRSPLRRRSLQFHFRGAETRVVEPEEYDRLFAEADGTPASCAAGRRA